VSTWQLHLGEAGACEKVVQAIMELADDENVKSWGHRAVVSLAGADVATQSRLRDAGSLMEMIQVLKEAQIRPAAANGMDLAQV
jgi:hypothetical protein